MNELAIVFNRMGISTFDVLEAAKSKWNFLPFSPGLVGGHCIGVDPYYLTHKAQALGYHPEIILAGRRLNDSMPSFVVAQLIKEMVKMDISISGSKILVLGLTFKENCPDIRNTKILDLVDELNDFNSEIHVHDPWVSKKSTEKITSINLIEYPLNNQYDAVIITVSHDEFRAMGPEIIRGFGKEKCVLFDLKNVFDKSQSDLQL
jgi:UDP-N-acetyl-D-galactosamine dehydrogenase